MNPFEAEEKFFQYLFPFFVVMFVIGGIALFFIDPPKPKPVVVRPPVKAQDVGKDLGSKTGRFVGGFIKGLWKQEEKK